jgi:hypothetical protein
MAEEVRRAARLSVFCSTEAEVVKVAEALLRPMLGLQFDGHDVLLSIDDVESVDVCRCELDDEPTETPEDGE